VCFKTSSCLVGIHISIDEKKDMGGEWVTQHLGTGNRECGGRDLPYLHFGKSRHRIAMTREVIILRLYDMASNCATRVLRELVLDDAILQEQTSICILQLYYQ
jgi:hypothetical protein